jgi:hypothetical protein
MVVATSIASTKPQFLRAIVTVVVISDGTLKRTGMRGWGGGGGIGICVRTSLIDSSPIRLKR